MNTQQVPVIVISANTSWYLYNFRRALIEQAIACGYSLIAIVPDNQYTDQLSQLGCTTYQINIDNKGTNPFRDFYSFLSYLRLYLKLRPRLVLHFTIKPIIYGSLAATILRIDSINTITGLGSSFLGGGTTKLVSRLLLKVSLLRSTLVFFQNRDDSDLFLKSRIVSRHQVSHAPGSGLDLNYFRYLDFPKSDTDRFVLVARLLWDKGIREYVEAAYKIKQEHIDTQFILLGPIDKQSRSSITKHSIDKWVSAGAIEYLGSVDDVRIEMGKATCVVLPSYREGLSRVLMEACAIGRPIITTDVPGCRDIVIPKYNGYLCRSHDTKDLAATIERFIGLSRNEKKQMGKNGRQFCETHFSEQSVVDIYLTAINKVISVSL